MNTMLNIHFLKTILIDQNSFHIEDWDDLKSWSSKQMFHYIANILHAVILTLNQSYYIYYQSHSWKVHALINRFKIYTQTEMQLGQNNME